MRGLSASAPGRLSVAGAESTPGATVPGAAGVPGALESAAMRPQSGYYEDLIAEAAALWESLSQNHPFVDENKRIAFAAADVFLRINGWQLNRAPMQIYPRMMQMFESGTFDIAHIDPWLRSFAIPAE